MPGDSPTRKSCLKARSAVWLVIAVLVIAAIYALGAWPRSAKKITWESREPRHYGVSPEAVHIELAPRVDATRDNFALDVTITNVSTKPVGWDNEFSTFLWWRAAPDGGEWGILPQQN
jgi:hypothetical protein